MSNDRPPNDRDVISELTTGRLSVYLRCLTFLESVGQETVSSSELAERFHLNSAQIRKDLACFGEFGTRGVGYNVSRLKEQLVHTLGIDRKRNVLIVGAGNLGMALADYAGFNRAGFEIVALVDVDAEKVGRASRSGIPVLSYTRIGEIVRELGLDRTRRVLIAGAGNLGMALADYGGFNDNGFAIAALVDNDPSKIGRRSRSGIEVLPWDELPSIIREHQVGIGIIAVTPEAAQTVYDAFADAGLNAVLNFAPTQLRSRPGVKVKSVDLRINLESLSFYLKNVEDGG